MKKRLPVLVAWLVLSVFAISLLPACSQAPSANLGPSGVPMAHPPDPAYVRTPPPVKMPEHTGENETANEDATGRAATVDMSNAADGYVMAQCTAPTRALMRVMKGDESAGEYDDYELANDGSWSTFPLARGDGLYTFVVFIYVRDDEAGLPLYERFLTAQVDAALTDEFGPYLVPNVIVNYTPTSRCVSKSYEITAQCTTNVEVVAQIYAWISDNITYDTAKATEASTTSTSYFTPDPDETLRTGAGICYDYASLAAAMLRANGIPTILVKGDVAIGDGAYAYHAWNLVWLEETGWIAVQLPSQPDEWTRIDTTFAASAGSDNSISQFIGNGENYTDLSHH